jgi:hypothetical protein
LTSKSKIPPQLGGAVHEPRKRVADRVQMFGFHGSMLSSMDDRAL